MCHQLTWLSLKGARLVSDVGVRHLAQGCKGLVYLDLTGLYLLSDGKNRSFGVEGVQALCQGCQKLKTLHLSDCPQLVDIALKSIAGGLGNLKRLVLANSSKMVEPALGTCFAAGSFLFPPIIHLCTPPTTYSPSGHALPLSHTPGPWQRWVRGDGQGRGGRGAKLPPPQDCAPDQLRHPQLLRLESPGHRLPQAGVAAPGR